MVKKNSFLMHSNNLQTQGFKVLADFLVTSGKTIEVKEVGYRFTNCVLGEKQDEFTHCTRINKPCLITNFWGKDFNKIYSFLHSWG